MGCEFGQVREWNFESELDWGLLDQPEHRGVQNLVRDLNRLLCACPALHQLDCASEGFEWIDHQDRQRSLLSFVRKGRDGTLLLVLCNFAPVVHHGLRLGVPAAGRWTECLNTDSSYYGGSNVGTPLGTTTTQPVGSHGRAQSILVSVPPLATVFYEWIA
jgi:1,4-alpha-glucan branching enzyme